MNRALLLPVFLVPLFSGAAEYSLALRPRAFPAGSETVLTIHHELDCSHEAKGFLGVTGELLLKENSPIRFELKEGTATTRIAIGRADGQDAKLALNEDGRCRVKNLHYELEEVSKEKPFFLHLALIHSPILHIRDDQYGNRLTDLPMALGYSVKHEKETFTIVYTAFFSDEDSIQSTEGMDAQMARYGRRADIEWVYEVEFRQQSFAVVSRSYHSDLVGGIGHAKASFRGRFWQDTQHPILYNIASHNVFRDKPTKLQSTRPVAYHLVPLQEIPKPLARESLMFSHPSLFFQSDNESARENKLSRTFEEQLFVRLRGKLSSGAFVAKLQLDDGSIFRSGVGKETTENAGKTNGTVDRLGEDLWGTESYSAIPIDLTTLAQLGNERHGNLTLEPAARSVKLAVEQIGILVPTRVDGHLRFRNLPALCTGAGIATRCEF